MAVTVPTVTLPSNVSTPSQSVGNAPSAASKPTVSSGNKGGGGVAVDLQETTPTVTQPSNVNLPAQNVGNVPTTTDTPASKPTTSGSKGGGGIAVDFQETTTPTVTLPSNVMLPSQNVGNTFPTGTTTGGGTLTRQEAIDGTGLFPDMVVVPTPPTRQEMIDGTGLYPGMVPIPGQTPSTTPSGGGSTDSIRPGVIIGGGTGQTPNTPAPETPAPEVTVPEKTKIPTVDIEPLRQLLEQWKTAADEQSKTKIEYAMEQAITELERAEEDAQIQFREQAESVALDERQGMDNAALYAEARGDKGGIGLSQYNEIQAAAAQNRLAVQQAQTKLSTDTARQIADLRAQGEFEKADAVLETTQTYLARLIQLEQWAAEYGLDAAQFQAQLDQWQAEFELDMKKFETDVDQWNQEFLYQQQRDRVSDSQWAQEFAFKQQQAAINNALSQAKLAQSAER